jgi:hypothetical protein
MLLWLAAFVAVLAVAATAQRYFSRPKAASRV